MSRCRASPPAPLPAKRARGDTKERGQMQSNIDLKGLRIAVTGGTSGLGLALVKTLVARGARVAFVARSAAAVKRVAAETGACGIVGDVGRKEDTHLIAL